ncbi:MAG: hypothetical protein K2W96_12600 [Gemmataceae bacterium]|nr:hypothetical protein [Gemmataceae bacterium]
MDSYRHIRVERKDGAACLRLRKARFDETEIHQLGDEILAASTADGGTKAALSLGPGQPDCLYSVFLAKLVGIRNALRKAGGEFVLVEVSPLAYSVFEACLLHKEFAFFPDFESALRHLGSPG